MMSKLRKMASAIWLRDEFLFLRKKMLTPFYLCEYVSTKYK